MDAAKFQATHDRVIRVMSTIEKLIPDGVPLPGLVKLDIALKVILKLDASLAADIPALKEMFAEAKAIYNELRAVVVKPADAGA